MSAPSLGRMLLVDDNAVFLDVLARAFARRGFSVLTAQDARTAIQAAAAADAAGTPPDYAVVDLKLPDQSGLDVVSALHRSHPAMRIVVLTGYASIATAVQAVKLGAVQYLAKPATPDEIRAALESPDATTTIEIRPGPPSVARLEWEHIQRVLSQHDGNISATARALKMHRRTLQRKLAKHPVAE
jgi:two-component system response regulator RegA